MKLAIPEEIRNTLLGIINKLNGNSSECFIVGGSVRDLILGRDVYDYDLATDATPDVVMKLFSRALPTGIKHGTVTVIHNQRAFEVTTYRADGKYIDGRHPDNVTFSSTLKDDVKRRDFTINGLAYDLVNEKVIDYVDGIADIRKGVIRTIGDPMDRFGEDGLRPFRACRFAAKLNFLINDGTFNAISQTLDVSKRVSVERIRDELVKMLEAEMPSVGLEYMRKSGLLGIVLPELQECYGVMQNKYHIFDVYHHSVYSCDSAPRDDLILRISALLHDIGKVPVRREGSDGEYTFYNHEVVGAKMTRKLMKRLKFSNDQIDRVNNLILNHMFHYTDDWTDGAVRRFMRKVGLENLQDLFRLRLADRKGNGARNGLPAPIEKLKKRINKVIEEENAITVKDLDINGRIIMDEFGLKPGPVIGRILNHLLEMVLDNPDINKRDFLIIKAGEYLNQDSPGGGSASKDA